MFKQLKFFKGRFSVRANLHRIGWLHYLNYTTKYKKVVVVVVVVDASCVTVNVVHNKFGFICLL